MSMLPIKQTPLLVFFNLLLLIAMFLLMRTALIKPYKVPLLHKKWSIFLMFVFVLFAFWGSDWFHYLEVYPSLLYDDQSHIEAVYSWIAQNLSFGYISFRFIIWGSSLIVLFAIFLLVSMYTAVQVRVLKNEYANFFGYSLFGNFLVNLSSFTPIPNAKMQKPVQVLFGEIA